MAKKFVFDAATGTMVPADEISTLQIPSAPPHQRGKAEDVVVAPTTQEDLKPIENEGVIVEKEQQRGAPIQLRRTDVQTDVQLVNDNGLPESYLDTSGNGVVMFRELVDHDICQIIDDTTGKVLATISGYALKINFNRTELNSVEKIEQCLQGIMKLFRHQIVSQALNEGASK